MGVYKTLRVKITGETPLLLHNGQLADPLNEWSKKIKAVSGKRKKTDADHEEISRLEWFGGLYLKDGRPCIPGENLEAMIVDGAKKQKNGQQAKAGVVVEDNCHITNGGADLSDLKSLWANQDYRLRVAVRVKDAKVYRTRPMFKEWSLDNVEVKYDPDLLNEAQVFQAISDAGSLGDGRPKYGRFTAVKI